MKAQLSFVLPAHNEESNLASCISAIQAACEPLQWTYEIVVAADACTDQTVSLAQAMGARAVQVEHRHIAATRNSGARAAVGEWLIFVDADTQVTPAAVRAACKNLHKGISAGGALFRFDRPIPLYVHLVEWAAWIFCLLSQMSGGCFLYCHHNTFEQVGGFDERLYAGEELAFAVAAKKVGRFRVVPHTVVTSGRKVRLYSGRELLRIVWKILSQGPRSLTHRGDLDLWYRRRPEKP